MLFFQNISFLHKLDGMGFLLLTIKNLEREGERKKKGWRERETKRVNHGAWKHKVKPFKSQSIGLCLGSRWILKQRAENQMLFRL